MSVDRRKFMQLAAMCGASAGIAGMAGSAFAAEQQMRVYWWGTPNRTERTNKVMELFKAANSGVSLSGEVGGSDYWPKLTTMLAGRNAPDIYQLEPGRFAEYSRRGAALPLNDFLGSTIRIDQLVPGAIDLGTVDGKTTGIPISINAFAMFYDADAFEKTGIAPPSATTTWDEFARNCVELTKAVDQKNIWAVGNCMRYSYAFQAWLTQRGKQLFNEEGRIGFAVEDAAEWYNYWVELAKAGGTSSAEIQALDKAMVDSNPLSTGNALITITFSNQLPAFQALSKRRIEITTLPILDANAPSGLFYRPGIHWAVASTAKDPELAARFIDFFINDPEAGKILEAERGAPVNATIQSQITKVLDEASRKSVEYLENIKDRVVPYPPHVPVGAGEFDDRAFRTTADRVAFGQLDPKAGAEELVAQANRILKG